MEIYSNLIELLKISSKTNNELGNQNVEGTNKAGEFIKDLLKDLPLKWTKIEKTNASNFWIAESLNYNPALPKILFSIHVDTVFKAEDIKVSQDDTKIYGSGAQDMKASAIVLVEVLKNLHLENKLTNIMLYISPEEETATQNYRDTIKELVQNIDYAIVLESTLDNDEIAPVLKRSIVTSRKGFRMFNLTIEGPGGHSGVISNEADRHSTILLACKIIDELNSVSNYNNETTFNPGLISGGEAVNVIAPKTELTFEYRYRKVIEDNRIQEEVHNIIKKYSSNKNYKFNLSEHRFYPPFELTELDKSFVDLCFFVAKEMNIDLVTENRGGGSEACIIKYFNPKVKVLDGFGVRGAGQHTLNEWVYKESILQSIDYLKSVTLAILA